MANEKRSEGWTPGPLAVATDGANTYRAEVVAKSPRGKPVVVARIPTPNRSPEQAMGNAHLFASAPDLYAALASIVKRHDARASEEPGMDGFTCGCRDCQDATAALARARGETP